MSEVHGVFSNMNLSSTSGGQQKAVAIVCNALGLLDNPDQQLIRELLMLGVGVLLGGLRLLERALSTQRRKLHVNYLCIFIDACVL